MNKLKQPYKQRPIRFMEILNHHDWKLKVYGISYENELPNPDLINHAKSVTLSKLPAISDIVYGVGYIGIHDGRDSNFVFLDWWQDENELHHHVFISPKDNPSALIEMTHTGISACVWDLKIIGFERQAWLDSVLNNPKGLPDLNSYLKSHLNGDF
ncbi:isochorismatase [Bacillus sp. SCS-151]|uniref:isochorismatase n=1 Tax=Nanhaiella sioensis TaxID=3115293 RepID=UPI00397B7DCC